VTAHHRVEQEDPGERPVTGRRVQRVDDVARLLAAEHEVVFVERDEHVAVADRRLDDAHAGVTQRMPQPEVRHHRDRDRVVAEQPACVQVERGHHHDLVTVDDLAPFVDHDHAVGVTVEGEAGVETAAHTRTQFLRVRRTTRFVDVATVG